MTMIESEYKELSTVLLNTVKELSLIVKKQEKPLEQRKDTFYRYLVILIITIALFVTIAFCCIYGQRSKIECVHGTVKVQISKEQ
jgi:heme/copper-type cytochrome/quinol oxidase subunit 2